MTNQINASKRRRAMYISLAATLLTGTLAVPAYADEHWERRGEHARRDEHRHNEYRGQPYGYGYEYYRAPPPVYYQQPGATLNFSFPFFR